MRSFITRRLFYAFLTVIGGTMVIFALSRMSGDPRVLFIDEYSGPGSAVWDRLGEKFRLNDPVPVQYAYWLSDVVRGDFGDSLAAQRPVVEVILGRLWNSVQLGAAAWALGTLVGVPLGVLSAVKRGGTIDYIARGFALFGQSLPTFWLGIMAILIFSGTLGWLPSGTKGEGFAIRNFILPAIVLGWLPAAGYLRLTRSSMLDVLDSEYVKFARAKGLDASRVLWKHAFRNALLAPITFSALLLLGFITGTTVAETVFSWPGLGRLAVDSVFANDFPVLAAVMLLMVVMYAVIVLALDLLYVIIDPRIRFS